MLYDVLYSTLHLIVSAASSQFQAYLVTEKANFFGMDLADQQDALQVRRGWLHLRVRAQ